MINRELASKILEVVDAGLCSGAGIPIPGRMCVEAVVCYAMGLPHGDRPPCVGNAVRAFKIALNDARWSSNAARAKGMRRLAVAQLGSVDIDQRAFAERIAILTTQRLISRLLGGLGYADHAEQCRNAVTLDDCRIAAGRAAIAARYAANAANTASYAASYAAAIYAAKAADAAGCAAIAASYTASHAAIAARYAGNAANDAGRAAGRVGAYLLLAAEIGEQVLVELGSPGCAFLELCA